MIIDLPDNYKKCLKYFKFDDYRVHNDDPRFKNISEHNKIRGAIINQKFIYAHSLLKGLKYIEKETSPNSYVLSLLLKKVIELQNQKNNTIYDLVKRKDYSMLLEYLDDVNKKHELSILETYIYDVVDNIVNFDHGIINTDIDSDNAFSAICVRNYTLALKYAKENLNKGKNTPVQECFYLVLNDLCKLINNREKQDNLNLVGDIIEPLLKNDLDNCLNNLDLWIKKNNYDNFRYILFNLIYLGPYKNDLSYTEFINTLLSIQSNVYNYNLDKYLKDFYLALSKNSYEEAKVYLNIIKEGDKFGQSCLYIKELDNILKYNLGLEDEVKEEKVELTSIDDIKDLVKYRHNLIENRGIVILDPMCKKERDLVHEIVSEYDDMVSFSIGEEPNKQVVLRYINVHEINEKECLSKATKAYYAMDYQKSMYYLKELLMQENPDCVVYAKMGLNFLKNNGKNTAIDYFKVATDISKKTGEDFDFTDLLVKLTGKDGYNKEEQKAYVRMMENEFFKDDYFCGIDCIYDIARNVSNGMNLEDNFDLFSLTEEEKALVLLIFAREYFIQGFDYFGYSYLKRVEEIDNKTDRVLRLYNEINGNRTLYKNQPVDEEKSLKILKLKVGE